MHNLDTANAALLRPDVAIFSQVTTSDDSSTVNSVTVDPPADLSPTTATDKDHDGHPMFGHPTGMQMTRSASAVPLISQPPGQQSDQYGVYTLVAGGAQTKALISPLRQQTARAIAPRPEESPAYDRQNRVVGYLDFAAAWRGREASEKSAAMAARRSSASKPSMLNEGQPKAAISFSM
jgi:hypothetical protein